MQIQERLRHYPVPDAVWDEYHLDQQINDRGIMIDREMVAQALRIDELSKADLTAKMQKKTGLDNPNSVSQMKDYLIENGMEVGSLGKKDVATMMKTAPEDLVEVLVLRLQLAKSSVHKYEAMQNAVCADGRCHGMFQFYGANRSGRWAGRLIQLQNLPQNHMEDLEQARDLVKAGDYEMLSILVQFGKVDVLVAHLHGRGIQAVEQLEGLALRLNAGLQCEMVGAGLFHGRLIVLQLGGVVAGLDLLILGVGFCEKSVHDDCLLFVCLPAE